MISIPILLPMLAATLGYFFLRKDEEKYYLLTLITNIVVFGLCIILAISSNQVFNIEKIVGLGIHLELDGFRKVYCLIISFMWMMTMLLSYDYFKHHHNLSRYYFFNLFTEGATLGVFLASDLYTALVFFEIMSFTSFPWVIQEETEGAIKAANTYLAVAVIGGLTALFGLFVINQELGTLTLNELLPRAQVCNNKAILYVAGSCILFGFGAKAGMFPLHIWLPKAHPVAPAPASSLLSGILTKSGIWGILAISVNIFKNDIAWGNVILILGTITMFLGALLALFSIDLKRTLACSSMSQVGFILVAIGMMLLLGNENALASRGAILHMMNHSLFKLVLFMAAGVVYMNVHKLDLNEVKGFGRNKPFLMICFLLAAAGIAGIPGLNGYISKTLIHEAIVEGLVEYSYLKLIEWIFLISGGLTLAYMTKLFICVFIKKNDNFVEKKKYMSITSYIALGVSAIILPIFGLTANKSMMSIADVAMDFFKGATLEHQLHFYSLENLKGGIISIVIGILVYVLIVNKFMIKDDKYIDLWPSKLDLEDLIYRPLLLKWLPNIFGSISRIFAENIITKKIYEYALKVSGIISSIFADNIVTSLIYKYSLRVTGIISRAVNDSLDFVVLVLRRTIYKDNLVPTTNDVENSISYKIGSIIDKIKNDKKHTNAIKAYDVDNTIVYSTHRLVDSLSFALFAMILAIVITFVYVFLIH
ncbi:MAG: complex I subunit 5 family protein [Erysipelotrichaceae bacterium]|nr:complex I subunit 5 family protein [Erysipelotrichaceae bacterium]